MTFLLNYDRGTFLLGSYRNSNGLNKLTNSFNVNSTSIFLIDDVGDRLLHVFEIATVDEMRRGDGLPPAFRELKSG